MILFIDSIRDDLDLSDHEYASLKLYIADMLKLAEAPHCLAVETLSDVSANHERIVELLEMDGRWRYDWAGWLLTVKASHDKAEENMH